MYSHGIPSSYVSQLWSHSPNLYYNDNAIKYNNNKIHVTYENFRIHINLK